MVMSRLVMMGLQEDRIVFARNADIFGHASMSFIELNESMSSWAVAVRNNANLKETVRSRRRRPMLAAVWVW